MVSLFDIAVLRNIRNYLVSEAITMLGTTRTLRYGVNMIPDGRLIDGRWDKQYDTMRTVDHSDFPLTEEGIKAYYNGIALYGCENPISTGSKKNWYYLLSNSIRFGFYPKAGERGRGELNISFSLPPTKHQIDSLVSILEVMHPDVAIDVYCLRDCSWELIYTDYTDWMKAKDIILGLGRRYFDEGCRYFRF